MLLQTELAKCLTDGQCQQNLICLQNCNGREDESQCQVSLDVVHISAASKAFPITLCAASVLKVLSLHDYELSSLHVGPLAF